MLKGGLSLHLCHYRVDTVVEEPTRGVDRIVLWLGRGGDRRLIKPGIWLIEDRILVRATDKRRSEFKDI